MSDSTPIAVAADTISRNTAGILELSPGNMTKYRIMWHWRPDGYLQFAVERRGCYPFTDGAVAPYVADKLGVGLADGKPLADLIAAAVERRDAALGVST